jgi:hypothetical protein
LPVEQHNKRLIGGAKTTSDAPAHQSLGWLTRKQGQKAKKAIAPSMAAGFSRAHMQLAGNDLLILTGC